MNFFDARLTSPSLLFVIVLYNLAVYLVVVLGKHIFIVIWSKCTKNVWNIMC